MRMRRICALAAAAGLCLMLSSCSVVDESVMNTPANYAVDINVPYATATPRPDHLNVPDAIVIDADGNVTLNDNTVIAGSFQSARDTETQTEYRNLSLGNTGIAVQALQQRLKELGYFSGDVSGLYDAETEDAVKRFEQTYGTMQTGVATTKLQLKLFADNAPVYGSRAYNKAVVSQYTVLRSGSVGSSVYALQQRLKNLNYPITELTGVYDRQTVRCVRLFYQAYGYSANDVASVAMQQELYSDSARTYTVASNLDATLPPDERENGVSLSEDDDALDDAATLTLGTSGARVTQVQRRLIELGYMDGGSDTGVFDENTQQSANLFLESIGRPASGMLTLTMQEFLLSDSAPDYGAESDLASYAELGPGDSGEAVLELQNRLVELGYASGVPNGQYGNATISAVKLYQTSNNLSADGIASVYLQSMLFSDSALTYEETQEGPTSFGVSDVSGDAGAGESDTLYFTLASGASGSAVATLQERLAALGYLKAEGVTGSYDSATVKAVKLFQKALGAKPTGEATDAFQRYIYSKAAPKAGIALHDATQNFTALTLGSESGVVKALQKRLWELGFLDKDAVKDSYGAYNEATRDAVASAQRKMGYRSPDGVAGVEFLCFLSSPYSKYLEE